MIWHALVSVAAAAVVVGFLCAWCALGRWRRNSDNRLPRGFFGEETQ